MSDGAKISETLAFLTQIHTAWDNTEQRAALRSRPRRTISYDYIGMESWQSQYLRSLTYAQQTQIFQIPLWHAADRLYDTVYKGQANMHVNVENIWQYRGCSGALMWRNDSYGGDYFPINELTATGIVALGKQLQADWIGGSGIMCPVAWGMLSQSDKYTNVTGEVTSLNLTVEMMKEAQAPMFPVALNELHDEKQELFWGKNLSDKYNGLELFLRRPTWANDMSANFSRNAKRLDNDTGFFRYDLKSSDPTETRQIDYVVMNRSDANNMQRFFYRCKGRLHSFYAPTWLQDVDLTEDASSGQSYLIAQYPYYWKYFSSGQRRKTLIVFYKDGTADILKVAGYGTDDSGEHSKIYLETPLKKSLIRSNIVMISFLCQYRHDDDSMTLDFESVDVATTSFTFAEVTQ